VFQILKNPEFDFMSRRNAWLAASGMLVLAAVVVLWVNGLNFGIEFSGGTEIQVKFAQMPDIAAVRSTLSAAGLPSQSVTTIGDPLANEVYIRLASGAHLRALEQGTYVGPLAIRSQSYIGPAVGRELLNKAMFAVIGSLIGMLIYIWIRFQLQWGLAAVVALAHDTLITLGLFSLFGMEMSLSVVAAFLTLIGYSVNDTVVVFDRIRENMRLRRSQGLTRIINDSINQTLSRTVITSGLTWIVVFSLFLFGGAALQSFAFVLSIGVVVGTYSSIYVASPFLLLWRQLVGRGSQRDRAGEAAASGKARKVRAS